MDNSLDWNNILPEPPTGPALYWRHRWHEYQANPGLPLTRGTMQNLDSEGRGPEAIVIAGKVAYRRESLLKFLNTLQVTRLSKKRIEGRSDD